MHTDASELGLEGVLYQRDDEGVQSVIAYASRSLSHTEKLSCSQVRIFSIKVGNYGLIS